MVRAQPASYTCISADCHIDMVWLPPDLFTSNAAPSLRDRMPRVAESPDGPIWVAAGGVNFGLACGMGGSGRKYVPGTIHRADRMAAEGLYGEESRRTRRATDPHQRVKDQDRDGVQAEVLYGIIGAINRLNDLEVAAETVRIYNDWLADFCGYYPQRLLGLAVIPANDIAFAEQEIRRAVDHRFKGIELACSKDMVPLLDRKWEPVWGLISELGLPIHFHSSSHNRPAPARDWSDAERRASHAVLLTLIQISDHLPSLIFGGVLERHPRIKAVLGESGIGWIPYILDRMDYEWEEQFVDLGLKMKPSEYWKRQCKATFQYDEIGVKLLDFLGEDSLMWSSDFPHPDGVWPDSQEYIKKQFAHLPASTQRKILAENAVLLYGL